MQELTVVAANLPANIEDLSKFVLVGREKLTSVRAEIRAISKLELAKEVKAQKEDEYRMLNEALLEAEVRLGELMKQIPKAAGGDRKSEKIKNTSADTFDRVEYADTHIQNPARPKSTVIQELGFSKTQAQRLETLADNKDLVEQAKAEARETGVLPSRTKILELAKARKAQETDPEDMSCQEYSKYLDRCKKIVNKVSDILSIVAHVDIDEIRTGFKELGAQEDDLLIEYIDVAIPKLSQIRNILKELIK